MTYLVTIFGLVILVFWFVETAGPFLAGLCLLDHDLSRNRVLSSSNYLPRTFKMAVGQFFVVLFFSFPYMMHSMSIKINLAGTWIVQNANKSFSVPGEVPGNVHTALYRNGLIKDPYFRFNDVKYRWIAYDNWTYTRSLEGLNILFVVLLFQDMSFVLFHEEELYFLLPEYPLSVDGVARQALNSKSFTKEKETPQLWLLIVNKSFVIPVTYSFTQNSSSLIINS